MTVAELEDTLDERSLTLQAHPGFHAWVVWLYASDDPAIMVTGEAETLAGAIGLALAAWDRQPAQSTM